MTERNARPATNSNAGWNTGSVNTATDPTAERAAGWAFKAIPGYDEFNYLFKLWGDFLLWLEEFAPREWSELSEGIAAADEGDLFRVLVAPSRAMGAVVFTHAGAGGDDVHFLCTDGLRLFYAQGATADEDLTSASPVDGTTIQAEGLTQIMGMCCDGRYVYFLSVAGSPGLWIRDAYDLTAVANIGTVYGVSGTVMVANGAHVVAGPTSAGADHISLWSTTAFVGSVDTGLVDVVAVAIDHQLVFAMGGEITLGSATVLCYNNALSLVWTKTLDTNLFVGVDMVTDGERLYVCCEEDTLAAGGVASVFCLSRMDGTILWTWGGAGTDMVSIAVDDRYIYVHDGTSIHQIDKATGHRIGSYPTSITGKLACDGVSLYGQNLTTSTNFTRQQVRNDVTFAKVAATDIYRKPPALLASPH